MNRRTFEEMVSYFNQTVADMDIDRKYKMELLGMITAILQRHNEDMKPQPEIIRCKDCKHYVAHSLFGRSQGWCERLCDEFDKSLARETEPDDYCSRAEPYKGEQE